MTDPVYALMKTESTILSLAEKLYAFYKVGRTFFGKKSFGGTVPASRMALNPAVLKSLSADYPISSPSKLMRPVMAGNAFRIA